MTASTWKLGADRPLRILLMRASAVGAAFVEPRPPAVTAPLGTLYLASALRAALGDEVDVEIGCLSTSVRSAEEIAPFLASRRPHLLGISASLVEEPLAAALVQAARAATPAPVTILGGPYPTCSPERALRRTGADFVVQGEGEHTAVHLVRALCDGAEATAIAGVARLSDEGDFCTGAPASTIDDLDALPLPAWDAIPIETYSRMYNFNDLPLVKPLHVPLLTSRGCPYRCSYCHNTLGKQFRPRSPDSVLCEIELLHDRYGVSEFHVVDDIFNFDGDRVMAICRGIRRRGLDIALTFPNGVRGELFTREQLQLLHEAGCYSITFALESASPRILKRMRRQMNLDRLADNVRFAAEAGIIVSCFIMFGYPGETREDLDKTVRWVRDSHVDLPRHSIVSPFPGTELANHAREAGLDDIEVDRAGFDAPNQGLAQMPPDELKQRVREGLAEIMAEPRRQQRLKEIWARWSANDYRYMGHPPPEYPRS